MTSRCELRAIQKLSGIGNSMKIIVIQPAVPTYRLTFFEKLSARLGARFCVYSSDLKLGVLTEQSTVPNWCRRVGSITNLIAGFQWQHGIMDIEVSKGDIVVIWGTVRALSSVTMLIKCRIKGAKTVWWGHYWSSTSTGWRVWLRKIIMNASDYLLFYTDQETQEFCRWVKPTKYSRVHALNNGIETSAVNALRAPYSAQSRPPRLLFIGRLTAQKEIPVLLQALAICRCSLVKLDIIGAGPEEDNLSALASELNVSDRVSWHGGTTDEGEISAVANRCRAFVYPGPVGLSLIHGFAYGLPAIVHDDRWRQGPEIAALSHMQNGIVFRKGEPEDLANVIDRMINNIGQLDAMSAAAKKTVQEDFNVDRMVTRFEKLIGIILDEKRR